MDELGRLDVRRMAPADADSIRDCIVRVYGDTYANEIFYDPLRLAGEMRSGRLCSIGAVRAALASGYWFCGWLPGFEGSDVFRMQKVDWTQTNATPLLVNPSAQLLMEFVPSKPPAETS